jgi:chromosome segregation ATPase
VPSQAPSYHTGNASYGANAYAQQRELQQHEEARLRREAELMERAQLIADITTGGYESLPSPGELEARIQSAEEWAETQRARVARLEAELREADEEFRVAEGLLRRHRREAGLPVDDITMTGTGDGERDEQ